MKFSFRKFIEIGVLLITLSSVNASTDLPIGNTFMWWVIYSGILFSFWKAKAFYYDREDNINIKPLKWYLAWNIICILRGCFVAENYWEWKNLVGMGMVLLLPLTIYITTNQKIIQGVIATWLKYALPGFFILFPFMHGAAIGRYLAPLSLLLLFFPILTNKWRFIIIAFSLFVLLGDLSARSSVIKLIVPILLSLTYYCRRFISMRVMEFFRLSFLAFPIILFMLAVTGKFNVFKMEEYITGEYTTKVVVNGQIVEESLMVDTRTNLYEEIIGSALKYNYVIFGRTPARGYESASFGLFALEELNTGKMERFSNEVSILNIFTWTGVIGVLLYFFIFFRASYLAVNRSNNIFIKILGLFLAFRWAYAWVEDFSSFDLSYFFLWAMIGMCFSKGFREMDNKQIRYWVLGLFDVRYRRFRPENSQYNFNSINKTEVHVP